MMISSLAKKLTRPLLSLQHNLLLSKGSVRVTGKTITSNSNFLLSLQRLGWLGALGLTSLFLFQQKNGVEAQAQDDRKVQQEKIIDAILNKICLPWKSSIDQSNWIHRRKLEEMLSTSSSPIVCTILVGEHGTGKSSVLFHVSEGKRVLYHKVSENMDLVEVADAIFREYFFYGVDTKRITTIGARETLQEVLKRSHNGEERPVVILEVDRRENYEGIKPLLALAKSLAINAQVFLTFTDSGIAIAGIDIIQSDPNLRVIWVGDLSHDEAQKYLALKKPNSSPKEHDEILEKLGTRLDILEKVASNEGDLETMVKDLMSSEEGVENFDRLVQFHPKYPTLVSALLEGEPLDTKTVLDILDLKSINETRFLNLHRFLSYNLEAKTFSFRSKLHREAAKKWSQENRERVNRNAVKELERSKEK